MDPFVVNSLNLKLPDPERSVLVTLASVWRVSQIHGSPMWAIHSVICKTTWCK